MLKKFLSLKKFSVLLKFGFADAFINWMKIIYKEPTASVITNQNSSNPFGLYRGTRQGDPISPFIFALYRGNRWPPIYDLV